MRWSDCWRWRGSALAWAGRSDDELDPTLYGGTAGIVLALLEGYRHFGMTGIKAKGRL